MPTSLGWLVGVVDSTMQGLRPHGKETAVAAKILRCKDAQGSGLVDTSNSKKAAVGDSVDDRPFSARRIEESPATPEAAKAAFGDLGQRTAEHERGFVDGALSATKMAAGRLRKAWAGQVLEPEEMTRRRDTAIGELQWEKAIIVEVQKGRMVAALLILEQHRYDEIDAEMEGQLRAKEAAAKVEAEAQRKAQLEERDGS